jgi:hypothetical protein
LKTTLIPFVLFIFFTNIIFSQTATIKGVVKDQFNQPIDNVSVTYGTKGTVTDKSGAYSITVKVPKNKRVTLTFSHISFEKYSKRLTVKRDKTSTFSPKLATKTEEVIAVNVDVNKTKNDRDKAKGIDKISQVDITTIATAGDKISDNIKNKGLGTGQSGGELSSTYNVRGGNYDENLVYVNGIEVYRPFLVRSGQQEGLSFVNADMTKNVTFSSGGFEAKYGDKLSSVLDITYRKPRDFSVGIDASLLGASAIIEGRMLKDKNLSVLFGARHRNTSLFVNSKDIETNFKPSFTDVQTYISYKVSDKFNIDYLGNFAINKYDYTPVSRITNFGTISDPKALVVNYDGTEKDNYQTIFSAVKASYKFNSKLNFDITASVYNTQEEEHFDIDAFYGIGEVNADFAGGDLGTVEFVQGIGSQLDHARNDLDALITNFAVNLTYKPERDDDIKDIFEFGIKYQNENIKDRIIEWEVIDSAGFSIRPDSFIVPNDQPYTPFTGPIVPFNNVRATNNVTINRLTSFGQWHRELYVNDTQLWFTLGARVHNWSVSADGISETSNQTVVSPRVQFAIKPNSDKDLLFRISGGFYYQPPFYKELRDIDGAVNVNVKAQKSVHIVLGSDYNFKMWDRKFRLVSEVYYKKLTDVNPFTVDNVQIRYAANNNAEAYAAGLDMRISGEFVPGTESHFTFGFLQTKENIDDRGYIFRPTDQRLKFAILFQDYLPTNKNFRMHLNLVYNTGVPGGSPSGADPYDFQSRLKDYFRSDVGLSYTLVDSKKQANAKWLQHFKELRIGLELFNMFDVQNSITNTWVRDVASRQSFAIPNFLSGRVLNFKVGMRF